MIECMYILPSAVSQHNVEETHQCSASEVAELQTVYFLLPFKKFLLDRSCYFYKEK